MCNSLVSTARPKHTTQLLMHLGHSENDAVNMLHRQMKFLCMNIVIEPQAIGSDHSFVGAGYLYDSKFDNKKALAVIVKNPSRKTTASNSSNADFWQKQHPKLLG